MNHTRHDYLQAMDDSLVAEDIDIDVVFCEFVDCANEAATYVGEIFACQKHADLATPLFDIDRISEGTFLVRPKNSTPPIGKSLIDISTKVYHYKNYWECEIHGQFGKDRPYPTPCIHIQVSENRGID